MTPRNMAKGIPREGALFASTSSGPNGIAACKLDSNLGPEAAVIIIADSGLDYLGTDVYKRM
jgi:cysteine synthase